MLNEGEVICDKCDGTGDISGGGYVKCPKCKGKGKLDWVTNAMGYIKPFEFSVSSTSISSGGYKNLHDEAIKIAARNLAKEIDKEILQSLSDPISLKNYTRRIKYDN